MKKSIYKIVIIFTVCLPLFSASSFAQVAIIAHKDVPMDSINKAQLMDFYIGDIKLWSDGRPVIIFDLKEKAESKDTFYKYLGKSPSRMKSLWMKKMLSGEGDPPESVDTEVILLEKVASTRGGIGFISQSMVTDEVKVLAVISIKEE
jgi:ABC-type phosphate transport system substrate-binding protein